MFASPVLRDLARTIRECTLYLFIDPEPLSVFYFVLLVDRIPNHP